MIAHHTSETLLLQYASGSLDEASSVLVATHLALCPGCRAIVRDAEALAGAMLEDEAPEAMSEASLQAVLQRASRRESPAVRERPQPGFADLAAGANLPEPLRGYVGDALRRRPWRPVAPGLRQLVLATSDQATARLFYLSPGTKVPVHSHRGQELTMVLQGSYSDECGTFARGDVAELDEAVTHQPVVSMEGDCVALAVTGAPLRFRSWAVRLVQPLLGI